MRNTSSGLGWQGLGATRGPVSLVTFVCSIVKLFVTIEFINVALFDGISGKC